MKLGVTLSAYDTLFGPVVFRNGCTAGTLAAIKDLGYSGVDLFIDRKTPAEIHALQRLFQQSGLEITMYVGIFMAEMGLDLACADPHRRREYLALYRSQIEIAQGLDAHRMPIGNIRGMLPAGDTQARYQERLAASLHELCPYAGARGVTLCLEPTNRYECNTLNQVHECVDFIEHYQLTQLGLLLDTFHMNIEDACLPRAILEAGARIRHFHAPDSNRAAAGTGHLDYDSILQALKTTGYQGYLTLEAFPRPDALTCARTNVDFLRRKLAGLDQP